MNTLRTVLLLFCLLLAGAVAQLLAPAGRSAAEGQQGVQPAVQLAVRAEESPLYLPLVVNQAEVPQVEALTTAASQPQQAAQLFYGNNLERAFRNTSGTAVGRLFLPHTQIDREQLFSLPAGVREAFQFYYAAVEVADWGNVYVAGADSAGERTYAVLVTTDGDGGFLEVYGADGALLGAAQTHLGVAEWTSRDAVRRQAVGQ